MIQLACLNVSNGTPNKSAIRHHNGVGWDEWSIIATATPPEWHIAALENGYQEVFGGVKFGTANGKLALRGSFSKGTASMSGMETILTLPEGFRPFEVRSIVVFSTVATWCGLVDIYPNGIVGWNGHGVSQLPEGVFMTFPSNTELWM